MRAAVWMLQHNQFLDSLMGRGAKNDTEGVSTLLTCIGKILFKHNGKSQLAMGR